MNKIHLAMPLLAVPLLAVDAGAAPESNEDLHRPLRAAPQVPGAAEGGGPRKKKSKRQSKGNGHAAATAGFESARGGRSPASISATRLTLPGSPEEMMKLAAAAPGGAAGAWQKVSIGWDGDKGADIAVSRNEELEIRENLSGRGALRKLGRGTLMLTGTNSYTGGTIVAEGTLRIGDGHRGSLAGDIVNQDLVEFNRDGGYAYGGTISGRGEVHFLGQGTTTLTSNHRYTGHTVIDEGAVLELGGAAGSLQGNISNLGELVFNRRDVHTVRSAIGGNGPVTQAGTGTAVLAGDNHYTGVTEVRRGTLVVNGDQRHATGPVVVRADAALAGGGAIGGNVLIEDGGTLAAPAPGSSLELRNLVLRSGAIVRMPLDGDGGDRGRDSGDGNGDGDGGGVAGAPEPRNGYADRPRIAVRHNIELDGTLDIVSHRHGDVDRGVFPLFAYEGSLTDRGLDIGEVPAGSHREAWTIRATHPGRIDVVHDGNRPVRYWNGGASASAIGTGAADTRAAAGGGSGIWRAAGDADWSNGLTAIDIAWADEAMAVFGGRPGTVRVDDSSGTVRFSGAQFTVDGYTVAGPGTLVTDTADTVLRVGPLDRNGAGTLRAIVRAPIAGAGGIVKTDSGTLVLDGVNRYAGPTTLKAGTLEIRQDANLGAADAPLVFQGGTLLATADVASARPVAVRARGGTVDTQAHTVRWAGPLTGGGRLAKTGTGTLELAGANTANGTLHIAGGTVRAEGAGALGSAMTYTVARGATLDAGGTPQTIAGLANAGTVILGTTDPARAANGTAGGANVAAPRKAPEHRGGNGAAAASKHAPGNTLTVRGDYIGQDGELRLRTALGDSNSPTDRLVLDGGRASGRTRIVIVNAKGLGAATQGDGIEVVRAINGATTTAQSTRDAFALQGGHVDAGAYEYRLHAGDARGAGESWYLRSTLPGSTAAVAAGDASAPALGAGRAAYRPEVALYSALPAVLMQNDLAMLGNLHQREGDRAAAAAMDPDASPRRVWGRLIDWNSRIRQQGTVTPRSDGWASGGQLGVDLFAGMRHRVGVYGGTLGWRSTVHGDASGIRGNGVGHLQGRANYVGAYWTYMADAGWYGDFVVQQGHYHGKAGAVSGNKDSIRGHGTLVALETGMPLHAGRTWTVEPQAQILAANRHIDDVSLPAARIRQRPGHAAVARLGLRLKGDYSGAHGNAQPYARFNVWHGLSGTDTQTVKGPAGATHIHARRGFTSGEIAAGGTWTLNRHIGLYGEIGHLFPMGGAQRVSARHGVSAGLRIAW